MKNYFLTLIALMAVLLAGVARAADETVLAPINKEIIPGHEKPIPVSLSGFSGEAQEVIQFDLTVQGFSFVFTRRRAIQPERQRQWQSDWPRAGSHQQKLSGEQELHRRDLAPAGSCLRGRFPRPRSGGRGLARP